MSITATRVEGYDQGDRRPSMSEQWTPAATNAMAGPLNHVLIFRWLPLESTQEV